MSSLGKGLDALIPPQEPEKEDASPPVSRSISEPRGLGPEGQRGESESRLGGMEAGARRLREAGGGAGDRQSVFHIEVEKIKPNPQQPRRNFDEGGIKELAASIREFGLIQPIVVTKIEREVPTGTEVEYQLIAGERRLMAAKLLGLERIPAIVRNVSLERERLELAVIENIQRADLNPIELARAYTRLQDEFRMTQREVASRIGKSREAVANTIRLLDLPSSVQEAVANGQISESHGRLLLAVSDPSAQEKLFRDLVDRRFTTRELKAKVEAEKPAKDRSDEDIPPDLKILQEKLSSGLGAPVAIRKHGESGRITINFYSQEELENLVNRLALED